MEDLDLLSTQEWKPFAALGLEHPFFSVNYHTVLHTWILLGILLVILLIIRFWVLRHESIAQYLTLSFMNSFIAMCEQTLGTFSFAHTSFITALFIFILLANCLMIIPFLIEPTQDLNTTLALGIIVFFYIQIAALYTHGIIGYLKEYFVPIFIMFPLHVMGKIATVISMSFRLFGNIFGGATISHIFFSAIKGSVILELFGLLSGINLLIILFFGLFEGLLQAFVFTMLALTYLSIALQEHDDQKDIA